MTFEHAETIVVEQGNALAENENTEAEPMTSRRPAEKYIFVHQLQGQAAWQIARVISSTCGDDHTRIVRNIHAITDREFHDEVANYVFGQKLAGDLGIRSTAGHPKTDYGEPKFGSGWDMDEK